MAAAIPSSMPLAIIRSIASRDGNVLSISMRVERPAPGSIVTTNKPLFPRSAAPSDHRTLTHI